MTIRELLFFRLIGHLKCGLGSTGLLKEEPDTVKENLTSPWHSGASLWTLERESVWRRSGTCLCCQRFKRRSLNIYWYCQFSLSSVWHAVKPLKGWKDKRTDLAFHKDNYNICFITLCKPRLLIVLFLNKICSLMITPLIMSSSELLSKTIVRRLCATRGKTL